MSRTFRTFKDKRIADKDRKNIKPSRRCLNHGGCPYCEGNRTISQRKAILNGEADMNEYEYISDNDYIPDDSADNTADDVSLVLQEIMMHNDNTTSVNTRNFEE